MVFYIDPGTGSMLFTILIGVLSAAVYALKNIIIKLRFSLGGGKADAADKNNVPLVIFSDDKRYLGVFEPVLIELEKRKFPTVFMTASPDDPILEKKYEYIKTQFIGEGNRAFAKLNMLKADVVLSTTPGLDVYQWKRSRDVKYYVHLSHQMTDVTLYRMFGIDYYDAILVSGEYEKDQVRSLEALRGLPEKEVVLTGQPYIDVLYQRKLEADRAAEENGSKNPAHKETTVLLAPSWGPSAILSKFGGEIIEELLKTGYQITVRPHPQSFKSEKELVEKLMREYPESDRLFWNRDTDNFNVLSESDILISDFSSVMYDYALVFDRPFIYADTSFDKGPYDAWWLPETPYTFQTLERLGRELKREDLPHIKTVIDECISSELLSENREAVTRETWAHKGESASIIAEYLIHKQKELSQ